LRGVLPMLLSAPGGRIMPANGTQRHAVSGSRTRNRWQRIIAAVLVSRTDVEAAAHAGIAVRTLYRLKKKPEFLADLQDAKDAQFEAAVNSLRGNATKFADVLCEVAGDPKQHGNARVRAAESGLTVLLKAVELTDVLRRLSALEMIAAEGRK